MLQRRGSPMGLGKLLAEKRAVGRGTSGGFSAGGITGFAGFDGGLNGLRLDDGKYDYHYLERAARLPVVWACARVRATRLASMRIRDKDGNVPKFLQQSKDKTPLSYMNNMSTRDFMTQCSISYDLSGNIFFGVIRNSQGRVLEIVVLDPFYIWIQLEPMLGKFRIFWGDSREKEIIAIPNMLLPSQPLGLSPIYYQQLLMGVSKEGQRHAASFLKNSSVIPGVISSQQDLTKDQAQMIQKTWRHAHSGAENAYLPAFIGNSDYKQIGVSPHDGQLLQSRQFTDAQICG